MPVSAVPNDMDSIRNAWINDDAQALSSGKLSMAPVNIIVGGTTMPITYIHISSDIKIGVMGTIILATNETKKCTHGQDNAVANYCVNFEFRQDPWHTQT